MARSDGLMIIILLDRAVLAFSLTLSVNMRSSPSKAKNRGIELPKFHFATVDGSRKPGIEKKGTADLGVQRYIT